MEQKNIFIEYIDRPYMLMITSYNLIDLKFQKPFVHNCWYWYFERNLVTLSTASTDIPKTHTYRSLNNVYVRNINRLSVVWAIFSVLLLYTYISSNTFKICRCSGFGISKIYSFWWWADFVRFRRWWRSHTHKYFIFYKCRRGVYTT